MQNIGFPNTNKLKFASVYEPIVSNKQTSSSGNDHQLSTCNDASVKMAKESISAYSFLGVRKIFNNKQAYFYRLPNGQNVVLVPKKGPTVVQTYVNVGALNEPDNLKGISHFIEHNLFNGSKDLNAGGLFKKTSEMGASTNASTDFSSTNYYISSQMLDTQDLEETVKLHADMIQNPRFDVEQIEKERGPVTSEIAMYGDFPNEVAMNVCIQNLFNIKTTSSDLIAGTVDRINKMTRDDVKKYYDTWYTPDNMTTVITGEIEPANTMKLLSKYFTSNKKPLYENRKYPQLTPIDKTVRVDNYMEQTNSAIVLMGFKGLPNNASTKEKLAFSVLIDILANNKVSRLGKSLEKYAVKPFIGSERISNRSNDPTAILLSASCEDKNVQEVLTEIYKQINIACNSLPVKDEFERAKKDIKFELEELSDYSETLNRAVCECQVNDSTDFMMNSNVYIDTLTPEDIRNVAAKYLTLDKVSLSVVHPKQNVNNVSFGQNIVKEATDLSKIKECTLPNNIKYTHLKSDRSKSNISLCYDTKKNPVFKPGADLILSKMLDNGTAFTDKNRFYEFAQNNNIDIDFGYRYGQIKIDVEASNDKIPLAMKLIKESIFTPDFSPKNFENSKKYIKVMLTGLPKSASDKLNKALFPHSAYGYTTEEVLKSLDNITLNEVKNLYNESLTNSQAGLTTSGSDSISNYLINEFSNFPTVKKFDTGLVKTYEPLKNNLVVSVKQERNQATIKQSYKFKIGQNIKDKIIFHLMNTILGGGSSSRLFNDLREKQKLAYAVGSSFSSLGDTGIIELRIGTTTDNPQETSEKIYNLAKSMDGFKKHINMLKTNLCNQDELENAKKMLKQKILNSNESNSDTFFSISASQNSPYGAYYNNKAMEAIDEITPQDIKNAANYAFNSNSVTSVLGSEKTIKALDEYTKKSLV